MRYLTSKSLVEDLDADLTKAQKADITAYSAYLNIHASALLDLSLYVSAANWSATTRPAYSQLLSFPLTWTVPPLIRADAIERVQHLGLAELDSDFDPNGGLHLTAGRDALPETFRRHLPGGRLKKTVRDEMTPEQAVAIRLFGLTEDCLSTLEELLVMDAKRPRFFSDAPLSSLDCLAFGYLALMLKAPVPRSFIKDWIQDKAPLLATFVTDMLSTCTPASDASVWATTPQKGIVTATGHVLDSVIRNMPSLGEHYAGEMRRRAEEKTTGLDQRALTLAAGILFTGAALGYGTWWYRQLPPFGLRSQVWRASKGSKLSEFGALGSMLNTALGPVQSPAETSGEQQGRFVEVDSEVD